MFWCLLAANASSAPGLAGRNERVGLREKPVQNKCVAAGGAPLDREKASTVSASAVAVSELPTNEAIMAACIDHAVGVSACMLVGDLEDELVRRLLSGPVGIADEAEAAALAVLTGRILDRINLGKPESAVE